MTSHAAQLPAVYRPLRRALLAGLGLLVIGGMAATLVATDLGLRLIQMTARGVAKAGFDINEVKVSGTVHASRLEITAAVLNGSTNSMLFADLDDIRERIEQNRWVQSATVVRKLPGRIDIRIVERKPAALWQAGGQFAVIDATGVVLSTRSIEKFARLPRVVGADAAVHAPALFALLASAPEITRSVEAAVWVGSRRWDLLFSTGERLKLPEGVAATPALARFAQLNRQTPLFGRGFGQFDLRVTDRLVATPAAALASQKAPAAESPATDLPVAPPAPSPSLPAVPPASVREIRI